MKVSVYKDKIIQVLKKNHLLSIADIHAKIPESNFSTIFRNIEILKTEGLVKQVVANKDTILYELIQAGHEHDHFICTDCGDVQSIQIDKKALHLKGKTKVTDTVVHGFCTKCC
ncbi:MAG: transcriptional repressor [Patescibacteria group bacterium]